MDKNTDIQHEVRRLRLLAAVLDLQHYTSTESNIVHIPGGDRVIAIGTPSQVRALLAGIGAPAIGCGGTGEYGDMPCLGCDACPREAVAALTHCAAGRDGECGNAQCPQLRDNEPSTTGRHCPLDSGGGHHD